MRGQTFRQTTVYYKRDSRHYSGVTSRVSSLKESQIIQHPVKENGSLHLQMQKSARGTQWNRSQTRNLHANTKSELL